MDTLEDMITHLKTPLGVTGRRIQRTHTEEGSTGSMPASNDQPNWDHPRELENRFLRSHSKQEQAQPSDSGRRNVPEPKMTDAHNHTGYSRDTKAIAT